MRTWTKLSILAFIGVGAGSLLASCGDNSQTCGAGTSPNEDGICLPTGGGPDADPNAPDAEPDPDSELVDADTTPTVGGTIAIFDTTLTDPTIASPLGLGQVRGGAIRISFNDLTNPNRGGEEVYREDAGSPIGSCLITKYSPDNPPYDRLDAGAITVSGTALVKNNGSMTCTLQEAQGNPDPYLCTSHEVTTGTAVVGAAHVGSGAFAYSFLSPAVSFGMSSATAIAGAVRPANNLGVFQTATAHGLTTGQFVTIAGFTPSSFNTPAGATYPTGSAAVQVLSATQFAIAQPGTTAGEAVTTAGTFSAALNQYTGSNVQINGFTTGANAPLFNSGTSRFMVLNQLNDNTLLLLNTNTGASSLSVGTQSAGATVNYNIARQNPAVTTGTFIPLHDFLVGAPGTTVSDLRIQKPAQSGVWGAIDVTVDVPGEAVAPISIMSIVRSNDVVTVTTAANHGITAGQVVRIAGVAPASTRPAFDTTAVVGTATVSAYVTVLSADATTFTFAQNLGIDTFTGVGPAIAQVVNDSTLTHTSSFATGLAGATVTIAGAAEAGNNGTFPITASTANTITYTNAAGVTEAFGAGTSYTINESGTGGVIIRNSFALDTPSTDPSQQPHVFPTTTAENTADLNYSCDNNTAADATDDTCGDEANSTATATLKAMIISGSATKKSVEGLFPFQMPTEDPGQDEWLEWTCAYLLGKSADMPMEAVQEIIDFKPTRIEQQVLFVAGTLLDDGVNVGGLRVLTGHAIAGHQTFCPNAGTATSALGPVCAACNNGIDDDKDGEIDFAGGDAECTSATDSSEN